MQPWNRYSTHSTHESIHPSIYRSTIPRQQSHNLSNKRPKASKMTSIRREQARSISGGKVPFTSKIFLPWKCQKESIGINNFLRVHLHCNDCTSKRHILLPTDWWAWVLLGALLQPHGAGIGYSPTSCQHTGDCHTAQAGAVRTAAVPAGELRRPTETHGLAKVKYLNLKHGNF